jgi:hypothetical protein
MCGAHHTCGHTNSAHTDVPNARDASGRSAQLLCPARDRKQMPCKQFQPCAHRRPVLCQPALPCWNKTITCTLVRVWCRETPVLMPRQRWCSLNTTGKPKPSPTACAQSGWAMAPLSRTPLDPPSLPCTPSAARGLTQRQKLSPSQPWKAGRALTLHARPSGRQRASPRCHLCNTNRINETVMTVDSLRQQLL